MEICLQAPSRLVQANIIRASVYDNARAESKLLHTWITFVTIKPNPVQIGRIDGTTVYLSYIVWGELS